VSPADREERARAILSNEGLDARVRSLGMEREIAAVMAPPSSLEALRRLAPRLRELGYRYVALDLTADDRTEE
jgi:hypothetical protein